MIARIEAIGVAEPLSLHGLSCRRQLRSIGQQRQQLRIESRLRQRHMALKEDLLGQLCETRQRYPGRVADRAEAIEGP